MLGFLAPRGAAYKEAQGAAPAGLKEGTILSMYAPKADCLTQSQSVKEIECSP